MSDRGTLDHGGEEGEACLAPASAESEVGPSPVPELSRRPLVLTNDLDGVHIVAPFPVLTAASLLRRKFRLADHDAPIVEWTPPSSRAIKARNRLWRWTLTVRPFRKDSLQALTQFREVAAAHERSLRMAVLTGRNRDQHEVTRALLEAGGYRDFFDDFYLNEWASTAGWKEATVRRLVADGANVLHLEDDLRAALSVARVDEAVDSRHRVIVYLVNNASNQNWLVRRGKIELPKNVIPVRSLMAAAADFERQVTAGAI